MNACLITIDILLLYIPLHILISCLANKLLNILFCTFLWFILFYLLCKFIFGVGCLYLLLDIIVCLIIIVFGSFVVFWFGSKEKSIKVCFCVVFIFVLFCMHFCTFLVVFLFCMHFYLVLRAIFRSFHEFFVFLYIFVCFLFCMHFFIKQI